MADQIPGFSATPVSMKAAHFAQVMQQAGNGCEPSFVLVEAGAYRIYRLRHLQAVLRQSASMAVVVIGAGRQAEEVSANQGLPQYLINKGLQGWIRAGLQPLLNSHHGLNRANHAGWQMCQRLEAVRDGYLTACTEQVVAMAVHQDAYRSQSARRPFARMILQVK